MRTSPILACLLLLVCHAAHAQVAGERVADYRAAAERGVAAFNGGDLAGARQHFERAARILPNPRIYRLLGRVALAEGRFVEAAERFHRALSIDDAGLPLSDRLRREVETELLPEARRHVAEYRLDLDPADALITVDGRGAEVNGGVLVLAPGAHAVAVEAPGFERVEHRVEATPGAREVLRLHLRSTGATGTHASGALSTAGIASIAGGAAVLVGGAVLVGVGWAEAGAVDNTPDWPAVEGAAERAAWMIPTGYVLVGVGAAAALAGGLMIALAPADGGPSAALELSPNGIRVRGVF